MPRRKTHEDFVMQLNEKFPNIKVVGLYTNNKTKIEFQCLVDGCFYKWMARPDNILSGYGCPQCANKKISILRTKTHEEFIKEVTIKNPYVKVLGKYVSDDVKIEFQCANYECGHTWLATPDKIIHKITGCPECAKINRAKKKTKTHERFVDEVKKKNSNIDVVGKYVGVKTKIEFRCCVCGNTWTTTPDSILNSCTGCPVCAQSHGESDITNWLKNNSIDFITQYKFVDCKDIEPLPFDFYLHKYNICIEYDGIQHFQPVNFGGIPDEIAEINFKKTQLHDDIKNTYCKQHDIALVRISYLEKDNINIILSDIIEKHSLI